MSDYATQSPPNIYGPDPMHCIAQIKSVENSDPASGYPANVNKSAALSYSCRVQTAGSGMMDGFTGVIPGVERWPSPWMVQAFSVGRTVPATIMNGQLFLNIAEERWAAPCNWTPGTGAAAPPSSDTPAPPPLLSPPNPPYPGAIP